MKQQFATPKVGDVVVKRVQKVKFTLLVTAIDVESDHVTLVVLNSSEQFEGPTIWHLDVKLEDVLASCTLDQHKRKRIGPLRIHTHPKFRDDRR